jgi:hypothetical protein
MIGLDETTRKNKHAAAMASRRDAEIRELRPCDGRSTGAYFGQGLWRKQNIGAKV